MELSFDFAYVRHAMIKIAYELAFFWLGEAYLDDPSGAELRSAICEADPASTDRLPACVGDEAFGAFNWWSDDKTRHLAYTFVGEGAIAIAVRLFDVHAAVVWVTNDAARYLSVHDAKARLRFLSIDPTSKHMSDVPVEDEWRRIGIEIMSGQRNMPPL